MNIFGGLEEIVEKDYPLGRNTWYGLGGSADYFIKLQTIEQLREVVSRCSENGLPYKVIGFGSNLLISDEGVRGAVLRLDGEEFRQVDYDGNQVTAGTGVELSKIVLTSVQKGLSGLEALIGIPGSVGGAVRMNAGGNFGDIGTVVESVKVMDREGNILEKNKPELSFDYRRTNITAKFILEAKMFLSEGDSEQIMRTLKEIWIYKKNTQPLSARNSGCIFKNPRGVSAGALIDRAGLKGIREGGAVVSDKHANFIIAEEGCTSKDVLKLIERVKKKVKEQFDVELELEIEIWK
jgi:UDP-N-acetylmuramate dehydrogenase